MKNYSLLHFSKVCTHFYQNLSGKGNNCIQLTTIVDNIISDKTLTLNNNLYSHVIENNRGLFQNSLNFNQSKCHVDLNENTENSLQSVYSFGLLFIILSTMLFANFTELFLK